MGGREGGSLVILSSNPINNETIFIKLNVLFHCKNALYIEYK